MQLAAIRYRNDPVADVPESFFQNMYEARLTARMPLERTDQNSAQQRRVLGEIVTHIDSYGTAFRQAASYHAEREQRDAALRGAQSEAEAAIAAGRE